MKTIQHTCDFCGFYYEEKVPAGFEMASGMLVIINKHMCLDCQKKTNEYLGDMVKIDELVLHWKKKTDAL